MPENAALTPALEAEEPTPTPEPATTPEPVPTPEPAPTPEPVPTLTFADLGLAREIVTKLERSGVTTPFPIQAATIPDALAGKDILGRGRTGSGKTLAFGLPLLTTLSGGHTAAKRPRGLILTPTRELAMQVAEALQPYGDVLGLSMKVVCGGTSMGRQIGALERGVDVLVATPGRLRDVIERGACSLDRVQIAVLDEADQMADLGFLPEVTELLDQVPAGGQRMLFSATLEKEVGTLVKRYLVDPVSHEVDPSAGAVTTMTHHVFVVKPKDKAPVTAAIAARKGRTIAFVRTQLGADRVADQLREAGVRADALHGGMTQGARTRTLADFKDGRVHALVATDVAARGIHVDGIDLVLNVDPAGDHKDYLHRAGRTARAGESGTVVSLALPHQRRTVFRLLEDAAVDASRHLINGRGAFDEDVARITGARSIDEVQAESAALAATQAEHDITNLERQLERARRHAAELREDADRLAARAARARGETPQVTSDAEPYSAPPGDATAAEHTAPAERSPLPVGDQAAPAEAAGASTATPEAAPTAGPAERDSGKPWHPNGRRERHDRREERFRAFDNERAPGTRDDTRDDTRGGSGDDRRGYDSRDSRGSYPRRDGGSRPYDRDRRAPSASGSRDSRGGYGSRDSRGGYGTRDDRGDRGGSRPYDRDRRDTRGYGTRDDRGSYGTRDPRGRSSSRDDRDGGSRPYDRDRRDPSASGSRDSRGGYGSRDSRGGYGTRDDRGDRGGSRPYDRDRRDTRGYGSSRDDRGGARPYNRDGSSRPYNRDRRDSRPGGGHRPHEPARRDDRRADKPRWKRGS